MKIAPEITKIDIELAGTGLIVRQWRHGWRIDGSTAPDSDQFIPGGRIVNYLFECEKQGFTCEMCDPLHGRALRGEITRIDFIDGRIRKYPYGWTAKTRPLNERTATADEIAAAIQWCKEHGWAVFEWPGGARAYRGEALPVRDATAIRYLRRQASQSIDDPRRHYDLAFYF